MPARTAVLLMAILTSLAAQDGTVIVSVVDARSRDGIAGVEVHWEDALESPGALGTTDIAGFVELSFPVGVCTLGFHVAGYQPQTGRVLRVEPGVTRLRVALQPLPAEPEGDHLPLALGVVGAVAVGVLLLDIRLYRGYYRRDPEPA